MILELDYIKKHGRYDTDEHDEDELLMELASAAEGATLSYLNCTEEDLHEKFGSVPTAIKIAVCMLINKLYTDRETDCSLAKHANSAYYLLINQYKRFLT